MNTNKQIQKTSRHLESGISKIKSELRWLNAMLIFLLIVCLYLILTPKVLTIVLPKSFDALNTIQNNDPITIQLGYAVNFLIVHLCFKIIKFILECRKDFLRQSIKIEDRNIALEIAILRNNEKTVEEILSVISQEDKDNVLKTGESTVDIEKKRITQNEDKIIFDTITSIFGKNKDDLK